MGSNQSTTKKIECDFSDASYTGNDVISAVDMVIMENILQNLTIWDLVSLCKTSKTMKEHVQNFALHYVLSHSRMKALRSFFDNGLLSPEEEALKIRAAECNEPHSSNALYLLKCMKQFANIRRFSVTKAIDFPHYGNPQYIVKEWSNLLKRDVVHLKTVCWLHFKQIIPDVSTGIYEISVHFLMGSEFRWPSGRQWGGSNKKAAQLFVTDENRPDELPLVEVGVEPEYWSQIKQNKFENRLLQGNAFFANSGKHWHTVTLKNVLVEKETTLALVWKDINNPWWKNDMYWDYVQIKEV